MTEEFKQCCSCNTPQFNAIFNALNISQRADKLVVDEVAIMRLLSFVNNILDYYLSLESESDDIRYPIILIPCAQGLPTNWVETVCAEFILYKIVATFDPGIMSRIQRSTSGPIITRGESKAEQNRYFYNEKNWRDCFGPIVSAYKNSSNPGRNLIVYGQTIANQLEGKRNVKRFLDLFNSESLTYVDNNEDNIIALEDKLTSGVYKEIENIFCIYSRIDACKKYQKSSLNNWHKLKNCFVFEFISAPYSLGDILRNANDNRGIGRVFTGQYLLSHDETKSKYPDFITLTSEESRYIWGTKSNLKRIIIPYPSVINDYKDHIIALYRGDSVEDDVHFSIKDRNLMSLCLNDQLKQEFMDYIRKEKHAVYEDVFLRSILDIAMKNFPTNQILEHIVDFVGEEKTVAFVICDVPKPFKSELRKLCKCRGKELKFYQYKDLRERGTKDGTKKEIAVKEKKIVILRFMPHNISSDYSPQKPNSFEEFNIRPTQEILDVINELTIIDYERYRYNYNLRLSAVTTSTFRQEKLGGNIDIPKTKALIPYVSIYNELDDDENERVQYDIPMICFTYADNTTRKLPESEFVVCEDHAGKRFVTQLRDLKEDNVLSTISAIQCISDLADSTLKVFFNQVPESSAFLLESSLREQGVKDGIIPKEHNENVPVWKFYLDKKIRSYCEDNNLIDHNSSAPLWELLRTKIKDDRLVELYRCMNVTVQFERVLKEWCDVTKSEPIAPGYKLNRRNLLVNYLGLNSGIERHYHLKQLAVKNSTLQQNKTTEGFLKNILYTDITDELSEELLGEEQYVEAFALESKADIEALRDIAEKEVNLKSIKDIQL